MAEYYDFTLGVHVSVRANKWVFMDSLNVFEWNLSH